MEKLLHYIWKHRILPLHDLSTTDGRRVEIIDPGLANQHSGPDFFNAKVRIGDTVWVGNVEIHERSADWFLHGHDSDPAYNNVVLHVATVIDMDVVTADGTRPPQLQLDVPPGIVADYQHLLAADRYPPCRDVVQDMPILTIHSWMSALETERMRLKSETIQRRVAEAGGSWEEAFFRTLSRSFGFGVNGEAFEQWAHIIPLMQVGHHRDDEFQVEALFMGMAGLLQTDGMTERQRQSATADPYFARLSSEFAYLSHKFGLTPMSRTMWKFMRLRPQNFPYIRLSQLTRLYCSRRAELSAIASCTTIGQLRRALATDTTPYWLTHYTFGKESRSQTKRLSAATTDTIIINAVAPMLHAYGQHRHDDRLMTRAVEFLEGIKAEDNSVVRMWAECGVKADNAADSQAILQLHHYYCERKDCLRCRFGYFYLKNKSR